MTCLISLAATMTYGDLVERNNQIARTRRGLPHRARKPGAPARPNNCGWWPAFGHEGRAVAVATIPMLRAGELSTVGDHETRLAL
jgi:hypothetical protein